MERVRFTQVLFAISSASLAILSLAYGDSAQVGLSLPGWFPLRHAWIDGAALLLLVASAGLCFSRSALASALTIGAYLLLWALTSTPQIFSSPLSFGGWYGFCEALTSVVGAGIRLPHRTCPRCGRIWHRRRRPPPPGSHPRSNHDDSVRLAGLGTDLFRTAPPLMGDATTK